MKKLIIIALSFSLFGLQSLVAAKKVVLDAKIEEAIENFYDHTSAGEKLAGQAEGMLVFPSVGKAAFVVGGEYGEGALLVNGEIVQYYRIASGSVGFQAGAQTKSQVILFMDEAALNRFRKSEGWKAGVDGNVAIANIGAGGEIDTETINGPVVAFVFGNKGLMADVSLEGSKISKIEKRD